MPSLRCRHCHEWYKPERAIPDICPHCKREANWTTEPLTGAEVATIEGLLAQPVPNPRPSADPDEAHPYALSRNDIRLLKSFRISTA